MREVRMDYQPNPADLTPQPWERLADVLLEQEAALCRIVAGIPPRDFAGLFIGHDDVDALLRSLPGLDGPEPSAVNAVRAAFTETVAVARETFSQWLDAADRPFAQIARRTRSGREEAEVLALLCAVELNPQRQRLVSYVQDSVQLPRLTLATLGRLFGPDHIADRAVAPGGALRRAEHVAVDDAGPWAVRMCGVPARVAWALRGDTSPDPDLPAGARVLPALDATTTGEPPLDLPVLLVHGADRESRLLYARRRHSAFGCLVTAVDSSRTQWAAIVREAGIADLTVVLEVTGPPPAEVIDRIESADHLRWVLSSRRELPLEILPRRPWVEHEVEDGSAVASDWLARFGMSAPDGVTLNREQLRLVAAACGGDSSRLPYGLRRVAGGHLESLAVRIRPRRTWSDLVLPADQSLQLRELAAQHRQRDVVYGSWGFLPIPSRGVVALFAGPSGTGKTLAAEVVAADLGLDLYKVDLSAVVSKWIGETEKNLNQIFEAAAVGELVLFFDEADALFGKRSEVSDARDRYANIEVAYLLQRLESYDGLVVMATNLPRNIDPAFLRRISIAVDFAMPEEDQRRAIWQRVVPAKAPSVDLDMEFLARRFKITGGIISNAARAAAFLAAEADEPITMEHIALALKREFQKLGRMRTEAEFGRYYDLVCRTP